MHFLSLFLCGGRFFFCCSPFCIGRVFSCIFRDNLVFSPFINIFCFVLPIKKKHSDSDSNWPKSFPIFIYSREIGAADKTNFIGFFFYFLFGYVTVLDKSIRSPIFINHEAQFGLRIFGIDLFDLGFSFAC